MWYGFKKTSNCFRRDRNLIHRSNVRDQRLGRPLPRHNPHPQLTSYLQVPLGWSFIMLQKQNVREFQEVIYLYRGIYFLNFTIPPYISYRMYDPQTSSFYLTHPHVSYVYEAYIRSLNEVFSYFCRPSFTKIRFKGKGYYIYKNKRNTIAPQFGYAHRVYIYAPAVSVQFLSKTKILIFGLSRKDILTAGYSIQAARPINVFTGRGVRFARQVIYRKTGKVSSYR